MLKILIFGLCGSYMGIYYVSEKFTSELYTIKTCALYSKFIPIKKFLKSVC